MSILDDLADSKSLSQIKNELFRILKGMTSGEAQNAIVQGMTRDVVDLFRRFISKGKSKRRAAVRELRQKVIQPRNAKGIADYDTAVAEWDSNVAKLVSYRGVDTFLAHDDLFHSYYQMLPSEVVIFAQLKVDEAFEPDCFREEIEKFIYRQMREAKAAFAFLASLVQNLQETLMNLEGQKHDDERLAESQEEQVNNLINLRKGKGKNGKGKGKGPNGGNGLCFNCGESGHFASQCDKPREAGAEKGAGKGSGKKGKGMNALAEVLNAAGLQISNMAPEDVERKLREGMTHLRFAFSFCKMQVTRRRFFMLEHQQMNS